MLWFNQILNSLIIILIKKLTRYQTRSIQNWNKKFQGKLLSKFKIQTTFFVNKKPMPKGHKRFKKSSIHSESGSCYSIESPENILAVKWNFFFRVCAIVVTRDWESLYGLFVYCVRLWSHNFFFLFLQPTWKEHSNKTQVHKSSKEKEGITKVERAFPLRHYYNQFLFILQFSDNFSSPRMGWSVCGGLLFRFGKHHFLCASLHRADKDRKLDEGAIVWRSSLT